MKCIYLSYFISFFPLQIHISVGFNYTFVLILQPAPYRKNCAREKEQHGDQKKYTFFITFTHINNIFIYFLYICGNTPEPVFASQGL